MLRFVVSEAERLRLHAINLTVNKDNPYIEAFKKIGFSSSTPADNETLLEGEVKLSFRL